jgi:hypothetical protein
MPYLSFISDKDLKFHVEEMLRVAFGAKLKARKDFSKNVIDPFSPIFEMSGFNSGHTSWKESELQRQAQKTLANSLGDFHQSILGSIDGWQNLKKGGQVDLKNDEMKIIAELKNKHNTVTGGKLVGVYSELANLVSLKSSTYKGYTAYFVTMIPAKPERMNKPFTPSDKEKGMPCPANEQIRIIDGASFFEIATGVEDSLKQLHTALPSVIEAIVAEHPTESGWSKFSSADISALNTYFKAAYNL